MAASGLRHSIRILNKKLDPSLMCPSQYLVDDRKNAGLQADDNDMQLVASSLVASSSASVSSSASLQQLASPSPRSSPDRKKPRSRLSASFIAVPVSSSSSAAASSAASLGSAPFPSATKLAIFASLADSSSASRTRPSRTPPPSPVGSQSSAVLVSPVALGSALAAAAAASAAAGAHPSAAVSPIPAHGILPFLLRTNSNGAATMSASAVSPLATTFRSRSPSAPHNILQQGVFSVQMLRGLHYPLVPAFSAATAFAPAREQ